MRTVQLSRHNIAFPSPEGALREPNGLLALGGDLSPARLLMAYQRGIFPWFSHGDPILWWSPDPRAVLWHGQFHLSRSMKRFHAKSPFRVTLNHAFGGLSKAALKIVMKALDNPRYHYRLPPAS